MYDVVEGKLHLQKGKNEVTYGSSPTTTWTKANEKEVVEKVLK